MHFRNKPLFLPQIMRAINKYGLLVLSFLVGATFLYSAYTKLVPIQGFEYTLIEDVHLSRSFAAIAARFFIGLEGGLGTLLLFHFFGKGKWVLKAAFGLVAVFSVYLIYLWIAVGNDVNCGCFGDSIFMSPSASLIKNVLLLLALGLLTRYYDGFSYKWAALTALLVLPITIALTFIIFPVFKPYKLDFTAIDAGADIPSVDLKHGKHIIAFLSPSCIHCRRAGLKIHEDHKKDPTLPYFMILGGTKSVLTDFWKFSHAQDIPYVRMNTEPFLKYTHGVFPYIAWVNNGIVEEETGYIDLSPAAIDKWMKH